jgi:hypothetical protein
MLQMLLCFSAVLCHHPDGNCVRDRITLGEDGQTPGNVERTNMSMQRPWKISESGGVKQLNALPSTLRCLEIGLLILALLFVAICAISKAKPLRQTERQVCHLDSSLVAPSDRRSRNGRHSRIGKQFHLCGDDVGADFTWLQQILYSEHLRKFS